MENKNMKDKAKEFINNVNDTTKDYEKKDIENGKVMAILSYLGILCLIPYFAEKNNKYVVYHAKQGLNLCILSVAYSIASSIIQSIIKVNGSCGSFGDYWGVTCKVTPWWISLPLGIISLVFVALSVLGIINAVNGKAKELPLVNKVKIIK